VFTFLVIIVLGWKDYGMIALIPTEAAYTSDKKV